MKANFRAILSVTVTLIVCATGVSVNGDTKIKSRVHSDGTVEYYSTSRARAGKKTANLSNNKYDHLIREIATREKVDPQLIRCIVQIESSFNADAVSVAGAMGLMQLMQEIVHYYKVADPFDPGQNLDAGIRHFSHLM